MKQEIEIPRCRQAENVITGTFGQRMPNPTTTLATQIVELTREQIEHLRESIAEGDTETALIWLDAVLRFRPRDAA